MMNPGEILDPGGRGDAGEGFKLKTGHSQDEIYGIGHRAPEKLPTGALIPPFGTDRDLDTKVGWDDNPRSEFPGDLPMGIMTQGALCLYLSASTASIAPSHSYCRRRLPTLLWI